MQPRDGGISKNMGGGRISISTKRPFEGTDFDSKLAQI